MGVFHSRADAAEGGACETEGGACERLAVGRERLNPGRGRGKEGWKRQTGLVDALKLPGAAVGGALNGEAGRTWGRRKSEETVT